MADNAISYAVLADNAKGIDVGAWESEHSALDVESASELSIDDLPMASADSYFARNREPQPDIVEGLIAESKITVLGGDYGVGKSPLIADLVLHITNGLDWCGRKVEKRPVIHFDFETPATKYKSDLENGAKRLGCLLPVVPDMLQPFFQHDSIEEPSTKRLVEALGSTDKCVALVKDSLQKTPNAVLIVDPVELFAPVDKLKAQEIVGFYQLVRKLFGVYPHASMLGTFNLRKWDAKKSQKANLLSDPRGVAARGFWRQRNHDSLGHSTRNRLL